ERRMRVIHAQEPHLTVPVVHEHLDHGLAVGGLDQYLVAGHVAMVRLHHHELAASDARLHAAAHPSPGVGVGVITVNFQVAVAAARRVAHFLEESIHAKFRLADYRYKARLELDRTSLDVAVSRCVHSPLIKGWRQWRMPAQLI